MAVWFLEDQERLILEKKKLEELQITSDWLIGITWSLDNGLTAKVEINAHNKEYKVELIYPALFPNIPPTVKPLDRNIRWSEHQYTGGELCLEWGPDNWHPSVLGADVVTSAYRLIDAERPNEINGETNFSLPSRHKLTMGQEVRGELLRLYIGEQLLNYFHQNNLHLNAKYHLVGGGEAIVCHILEASTKSEVVWKNYNFPESIKESIYDSGYIFRINGLESELKSLKAVSDLEVLISKKGDSSNVEYDSLCKQENRLFILLDNQKVHSYMAFSSGQKLYEVTPIIEKGLFDRHPDSYSNLNEKRIGIVGVGSLGSKVANSLARSGVKRFLLIDEDVFLSDNIQRHTLDWLSVGSHKVDAIKQQIESISSLIEVDVSRINLTGQEATTSLDGVLTGLGQCDVIIDATADSSVFNLLSVVSTYYKKTLFWGEVFAGGIGGLIARSRPSKDPDPLSIRRILIEYSNKNPAIGLDNTTSYDMETDDGQILLATDADVGVIANHLSRFIMDGFVNEDKSDYPYSMYLIGLAKGWIFGQPFETIPIETNLASSNGKKDKKTSDEAKDFILSLLEIDRND